MSGETTSDADRAGNEGQGIRRQTTICLFFTLLYYGIMILSNLFFARHLGADLYGDFAFIMAAVLLGSQIVLLGGEEATMRFVPWYVKSGAYDKVAGLIRFFLGGTAVLCILSIVFLWALIFEEGGIRADPSQFGRIVRLLALVALCIPVYACMDLAQKILRSFGMLARSYLPNRLVAPLVTLAVVALAVWLQWPLTVWLIPIAIAVGSFAALVLQFVLFHRAHYVRYMHEKAKYEVMPWLSFSVPAMITALMWKVIAYGDIMMLELLGPDEASVGQFAAAHSATLLLSAVYLAIVTVVAPIVSVAARSASRSGLQDLMSSVVTIVAAFAVPFCVLTVLFRHQVMALFGPGYEAATGVLVILTIGQGLSVLLSPSKVFLEYTGWAKAAMWSTAAAAGTNIVLDVILIPFYGIIGAAVATFLVLIGVALAWAVQLYRAEGLITRPRLVLPRLSG